MSRMERLCCRQAVASELLEVEPGIVDHITERMHAELGKALADMISDGRMYIVVMDKAHQEPDEVFRSCTAFRSDVRIRRIVRCEECRYCDTCEKQVLMSSMYNEIEDVADIFFCSHGEPVEKRYVRFDSLPDNGGGEDE